MRLSLISMLSPPARICLVSLAAAAALGCMMAVALAEDAGAVSTTVDFGGVFAGLIEPITEIAGMVILAVLLALAKRLWSLAGLTMDEKTRGGIEQILQRAVDFARDELRDRAIGGIPINLRYEAVAAAAAYAIEHGPDTLARIGITSAHSEKLEKMIAGRITDYLVDPEKELIELKPGQIDNVVDY